MTNLLKKLIFIAQFHLQDPDPAWRFESGSARIRIRNTALLTVFFMCESVRFHQTGAIQQSFTFQNVIQ